MKGYVEQGGAEWLDAALEVSEMAATLRRAMAQVARLGTGHRDEELLHGLLRLASRTADRMGADLAAGPPTHRLVRSPF